MHAHPGSAVFFKRPVCHFYKASLLTNVILVVLELHSMAELARLLTTFAMTVSRNVPLNTTTLLTGLLLSPAESRLSSGSDVA